ncbi:MAG: TylF/MycF/NovP-related O-methyltransferase [Pseudomonadota bacterium]
MSLFGWHLKQFDFWASGMYVRRKSIDSLTEGRFQEIYDRVSAIHKAAIGGKWPDFRWRAHTAVWAGQVGLGRPGAFVELGVNSGFLSHMICECLDFAACDREFFLFDTYEGTPIDRVARDERAQVSSNNETYFDIYETTRGIFAPYPNVKLVRGLLPEALSQVVIERIAYLSIDLNYAEAEIACIEALWDRLSPGCVVLLDDYAWRNHETQKKAWDDWAAANGTAVFTVPTGQGLLVK